MAAWYGLKGSFRAKIKAQSLSSHPRAAGWSILPVIQVSGSPEIPNWFEKMVIHTPQNLQRVHKHSPEHIGCHNWLFKSIWDQRLCEAISWVFLFLTYLISKLVPIYFNNTAFSLEIKYIEIFKAYQDIQYISPSIYINSPLKHCPTNAQTGR